MSDPSRATGVAEQWSTFVEESNEAVTSAFERNVEAQTAFVASWLDAVEESTASSAATTEEGLEAYARAYEVWMTASEDLLERVSDAYEGEDVDPEDFRDIWLNAANESFKEIASTSAFAAMTGRSVEDAMQLQREIDQGTEATLHAFGLASRGDVREVGERLVELERRQHAVESKLDRLLDDRGE